MIKLKTAKGSTFLLDKSSIESITDTVIRTKSGDEIEIHPEDPELNNLINPEPDITQRMLMKVLPVLVESFLEEYGIIFKKVDLKDFPDGPVGKL